MKERSHLVKMHIKNLGCINNNGLDIELNNIVCLVGANNAGKTTILKAYERAIKQEALKPDDIYIGISEGQIPSVELWVYIPENTKNIDNKWRDENGYVRSKWEWEKIGTKPKRTTWNPSTQIYDQDGKAAGLDNVFNSRLPQPFRIGSLENPEEEHEQLLNLVIEPIIQTYTDLMNDPDSTLNKKITELKQEAQSPINNIREQILEIKDKVSLAYRKIFNSSEINLDISIGNISFNPKKALLDGSNFTVLEQNTPISWDKQGTGSQRALFWSMLQVRSEISSRAKLKASSKKPKDDTVNEIHELEKESFLPSYMLLIDEPEIALHPSAVRAAKDYLYQLSSESGWQVMLSTHHPAFIDPMQDHTTIVKLQRDEQGSSTKLYRADDIQFSDEEKDNLKALMLFDSTVSEMFFSDKIIIVEGDTEFASFHEVMKRNPDKFPTEQQPLIIRARGKATITVLIKMLSHFKIKFSVLHNIDSPKIESGNCNPAYTINKKISEAISEARKQGIYVNYLCSCPNFELHHKMSLPDKDKPYAAWKKVCNSTDTEKSVLKILENLLNDMHESSSALDGSNFESILKDWVNSNGKASESCYQFD